MDSVGIQQGVEVPAGLRGSGVSGEACGAGQQREFGGGLVGGVGAVGLGRASPQLREGTVGLGEPLRGERRQQCGVDLDVGPAEGDQGVVARACDGAGLAAGVQPGGGVVVHACGCAERGRCHQRPVAGEVLAQQPHALSRFAEDVTRPHRHRVQAQFSPRPARQSRRGDRPPGQAGAGRVDDSRAEPSAGIGEEHAEHGGLSQPADPGFRSGHRPGPAAAGSRGGLGRADLAAPVRFGDRDARHGSGERGRQLTMLVDQLAGVTG